jgi:DNA modification methylase
MLTPQFGLPLHYELAFALQDAGWWLRQDIIWAKPNPMPESVTDRCTKSHEYVFLLSKSEKYYFDQDAILEPVSAGTHARLSQNVQDQIGSDRANGGAKTNGNMKAVGRGVGFGHGTDAEQRNRGRVKNNESFDAAMAIMPTSRNKRSVWTVPTESYKGAHFATYPRKLIEPCILAGCPVGGTVLDIFFGSGTTGQVAQALGRNYIGIDLDVRNGALQDERLRQPSLQLEGA